MKVRGWLGYLVGGVLLSNGVAEVGLVVFLMGMIADWKVGILGILSFCVGLNWT